MITVTSNNKDLFAGIDEAVSQLCALISTLDENKINTVPFKDSWTAGQLIRHIVKSTNAMTKAMLTPSKPPGRDPGEKIPQLKKAFLDFSNKMKSPDFIIPEDGPYNKQVIIDELNGSFGQFKENVDKTNLNDLVEGLPLGTITKVEILHFVLYHTQRHLHQLKNICDALKNK